MYLCTDLAHNRAYPRLFLTLTEQNEDLTDYLDYSFLADGMEQY